MLCKVSHVSFCDEVGIADMTADSHVFVDCELYQDFISELGDSVCTLTAEVVAEQQNCIDCMKNISSVLLTDDGNTIYIGAK